MSKKLFNYSLPKHLMSDKDIEEYGVIVSFDSMEEFFSIPYIAKTDKCYASNCGGGDDYISAHERVGRPKYKFYINYDVSGAPFLSVMMTRPVDTEYEWKWWRKLWRPREIMWMGRSTIVADFGSIRVNVEPLVVPEMESNSALYRDFKSERMLEDLVEFHTSKFDD